MKKLILILTLAIGSLSLKAQTDPSVIINALKSGNSDQVSQYFDKILDVKFPNKDEIKSIGKNQAGIALKSFYSENRIQGFEASSQREMSGTMYIAGKLTSPNDDYKLSMMLKMKDGKYQIITVRISS